MKTLTQVVLPILAFLGLVFGVTYMLVYSPKDRVDQAAASRTAGQALNFRRQEVRLLTPKEVKELASDGRDPEKVLPPPFWHPDYEVGQTGHADFWFDNPHKDQVELAVPETNCQCGSADAVIIPKEAWKQLKDKIASSPSDPISQVFTFGRATAELGAPNWKLISLKHDQTKNSVMVPPGALGFIRVNWTARAPVPDIRTLTAGWAARLPDAVAETGMMSVVFRIVPAVKVYVPGAATARIDLGTLRANSPPAEKDFICWSATQPYLDIAIEMHPTDKIALQDKEACISWEKVGDLTKKEIEQLQKNLSRGESMPMFVRSAAWYKVTVHERVETEKDGKKTVTELDLGPLSFRLACKSGGSESDWVAIAASVLGDVSIRSGESDLDRVDLGEFEASQGREKELSVTAQRAGLDLEKDSVFPEFLQADLKPVPDEGGLKRWKLIVKVPPGATTGALPDNAQIILKTKDPAPRKIRIPVKGKAFFNGSGPF